MNFTGNSIQGLEINGTLYDVTFQDGTYNSVFADSGLTPTFLNQRNVAIEAATAIADFFNIHSGAELIPGALSEEQFGNYQILIIADGVSDSQFNGTLIYDGDFFTNDPSGGDGEGWVANASMGGSKTVDFGVFALFSPSSNPINTINGTNKNDNLIGTFGSDQINGWKGKDTLTGLAGNDYLNGCKGADILIGVDPNSITPGLGEVDTLTGGNGHDTFMLGDTNHVYYNNGNPNTEGLGDYALITDFTQTDKIQLQGMPSDYTLVPNFTVGSSTGTAIFLNDTVGELIGLVEGVTFLALNNGAFSFV